MIKLRNLLNELFEGNNPYKWTGPSEEDDKGTILYFFDDEEGDGYEVSFVNDPTETDYNSYWVNFDLTTSEHAFHSSAITNKHHMSRILSTIMDIIPYFINDYYATELKFTGVNTPFNNKGQRDKIYLYTALKHVNKLRGWTIKKDGSYIKVQSPEKMPEMELTTT